MRCRAQRGGLTLVELLVTISIIGLLTAIVLPAVQSARESARRRQCQDNLRQIGLAMLSHESAFGYFPTGGWGGGWVGQPQRGTGRRQPGGWVYCILPNLGRRDLAESGAGLPPAQTRSALAQLIGNSLTLLHCPTRRRNQPYAISLPLATQPRNSDPVGIAARNDYAANAGDQPRCEIALYMGPPDLAMGDDPFYPWPKVDDHTGVVYLRSEVRRGSLADGSSYTYLVAEKYVSSNHYETGGDHGDDWSMYTGYQDDICRTAFLPPLADSEIRGETRFGSAHRGGFNAMFCDGSARSVSYDIDPTVHRMLANRDDALPLDASKVGF